MFLNGISTVTVGTVAESEIRWMLPFGASDLADATVKWELMDLTGAIWNSGEASDIRVEAASVGTDTHVIATASIAVPIEVPTDFNGLQYSVRWVLRYGTEVAYSSESLTVVPNGDDLTGPADAVGLFGETVVVTFRPPVAVTGVRCEVFMENTTVAQGVPRAGDRENSISFDTSLFPQGPSLTPYQCLWRYKHAGQDQFESSNLWLLNPTLLQAQAEVRSFLLKAYSDSGLPPGAEMTPASIMLNLQRGAENFNAMGYPSAFTMIRASGPLRSLWIACALVDACRSQYMNEGLKAFNFSGTSGPSLDVDRSQYWESLASNLMQGVEQSIKPFKENLMRRGILGGDGNINANSLKPGAVGSIGISITPASPIRGVGASAYIGNFRR